MGGAKKNLPFFLVKRQGMAKKKPQFSMVKTTEDSGGGTTVEGGTDQGDHWGWGLIELGKREAPVSPIKRTAINH